MEGEDYEENQNTMCPRKARSHVWVERGGAWGWGGGRNEAPEAKEKRWEMEARRNHSTLGKGLPLDLKKGEKCRKLCVLRGPVYSTCLIASLIGQSKQGGVKLSCIRYIRKQSLGEENSRPESAGYELIKKQP